MTPGCALVLTTTWHSGRRPIVTPRRRARIVDSVLVDHERGGRTRARLDLLLAFDERRLAAELALLQPLVGQERDLRRADQAPAALGGVLAHDLFSSETSAASACWKCSASEGERRNSNAFGAQILGDAHAPPRLHLLEDAFGELDGLQAAAEGLGEQALDQATESSFEFAKDRHASTFAQVAGPALPVRDSTRRPVAALLRGPTRPRRTRSARRAGGARRRRSFTRAVRWRANTSTRIASRKRSVAGRLTSRYPPSVP